jgi:AraC-like DNA-binding protein
LLDTGIRCLHNDNRLTLRAYCEREQRSAQTVPYLVRRHPAQFAGSTYVRENRPVRRGDPPRLVAKKLAKRTLAAGAVLDVLYRLIALLERAGLPERLLRRLYRALLGLNLFRGFRRTWP